MSYISRFDKVYHPFVGRKVSNVKVCLDMFITLISPSLSLNH